jgi:hypothetical protein
MYGFILRQIHQSVNYIVEGASNLPKLDDPTVLVTWASMRSITPEEDLLMMKLLVKRGTGTVPPVYGTFYVFEDGSAKFILQPSSEQKSLSGRRRPCASCR